MSEESVQRDGHGPERMSRADIGDLIDVLCERLDVEPAQTRSIEITPASVSVETRGGETTVFDRVGLTPIYRSAGDVMQDVKRAAYDAKVGEMGGGS